jgi:hypothetical protein
MNPSVEIAVASAPPVVRTELLGSLRASPTDLAKLVQRVDQRRSSIVAVSTAAVTRWNKDDPQSWEQVRLWLTARGVRIVDI